MLFNELFFPKCAMGPREKQAALIPHASVLCGCIKKNAPTGMHQECGVLRIYQRKAWKIFVPSFAFWKGAGFGQFKSPSLFFWTPGFPVKTCLSTSISPTPCPERWEAAEETGVCMSHLQPQSQGSDALASPHSHTGSPAGSPGGHKLMFKATRSGEEAREFSEDWSPVSGLTQGFLHLASHLI